MLPFGWAATWQSVRTSILQKVAKRETRGKVVDPCSKKNWNNVKAPTMSNIKTLEKVVMRTQGTKIAMDNKGHVTELSLANLQNDEAAFRKFKLITEDV